MYGAKTTLYEILGVARDAKATDIARAYNKFRASLLDDTVPPDARKAVLVKDAYEILSDPARRGAYDESLRAPKVVIAKAASRVSPLHLAIAAGVVVFAALAWYLLRPKAQPWDRTRSLAELTTHASAAVSRINSLDLSGKSAPLGLAFSIAEDVMATSCAGISPGMELRVNVVPRHVQARVMMADEERGLCKLAAAGTGSWPLAFAGGAPRAGEKVYATRVNAVGEATLAEGTVKRVLDEGPRRVFETTLPLPPEGRGGPLLDSGGRIVAIATATLANDPIRFVGIPPAWASEPRATAKEPAVPKAVEEAASPSAPGGKGASPPKGTKASKERQDAIEKAFRPPPSVPDDL